jgi:hypothetical protein
MTTPHTTSPQLRITAGTDTTPTPHKAIRGFFRETEDDIMDDPPTTNSNKPIPKTIAENGKSQTNNHRPLQAGEATHTKVLQQGYNPHKFSPVPVNSHKSIVPITPNTLHKRKLKQVTPTTMEPLPAKTANTYRKVCIAYNVLMGQGTDGKLTIDKLDLILTCFRTLGGFPVIDLTTDTPFTPDQTETTLTGNRDIKNEQTPGGMFGNTTSTTVSQELFGNPSQASTNPAVAAADPTRSTTEHTSARSNIQEAQEYTNAMQNCLVDRTTVNPGKNSNPFRKKRKQSTSGSKRKNLKQQTLGEIPLPTTALYPMHRECKSVTDTIMPTWIKAKYPLFTKEISIHCTEDDNKRKALNLSAALVGKTFPDDNIMDLLATYATNADQLPLVDLFRSAGLDEVVLAQDYAELQLSLQHDQSLCGLLRGGNSSVFNGVPTAHAILCAFQAKSTGATRHM